LKNYPRGHQDHDFIFINEIEDEELKKIVEASVALMHEQRKRTKISFQSLTQALATPEETEYCTSHTSQTIELYCKTCSIFICRDCILIDYPRGHRDHDFDFLDVVFDEEREKLKRFTDTMKQTKEQMESDIEKLNVCEKQVDTESDAHIEKIQVTYNEVYKLLKQQEETVEKMNTIKASFKNTLFLQKENAKLMENQLVNCDGFCENVVTDKTRQLLTYNKWIENRVDELIMQVEHANLDPEHKPSDIVVNYRKPVDFLNDSVCNVSCVPNLSNCTVSGPEIIYGKVKVTVTLEDSFGYPVVYQSKDIEIHCNNERENAHIEEERRGQYHIWYNPKRKEGHSLSVYWRGSSLNHEEIKVLVNVRYYATIKQEVKIIENYGPSNKQL